MSIFVRGVPGGFWVLFLILPLSPVTLVTRVTCSLVCSIEMPVFTRPNIAWNLCEDKATALRVRDLTRLYAGQRPKMVGGQHRLGCRQLSNPVLQRSCVARPFHRHRDLSEGLTSKAMPFSPHLTRGCAGAGIVAATPQLYAEIEALMESIKAKRSNQ